MVDASKLDEPTRALLARASRTVPARSANEEIDRERLRQELAYGLGLSYEVMLEPQRGFGAIASDVAPRLARFLHGKKKTVSARGVFVSLFVGEQLHFIDVRDFFDAVREGERLSEAAFRVRVAAWEKGTEDGNR